MNHGVQMWMCSFIPRGARITTMFFFVCFVFRHAFPLLFWFLSLAVCLCSRRRSWLCWSHTCLSSSSHSCSLDKTCLMCQIVLYSVAVRNMPWLTVSWLLSFWKPFFPLCIPPVYLPFSCSSAKQPSATTTYFFCINSHNKHHNLDPKISNIKIKQQNNWFPTGL